MTTSNDHPPTAPDSKLELLGELKLPSAVLSIDATPDGTQLFAACLDGGVYQVNLKSGQHQQLGRHDSYASGVCLLPEASILVSAGYDGVLQWHDPDGRALIRKRPAHRFWSWQLARSPNENWVASVSGQYLPGGYQYEPSPAVEPSVMVFDARTGELVQAFFHRPPVLSVAFSPNSRLVAVANMMGEISVWELPSGRLAARWTTPDFTSWGTVKSHHFIGGIFSLLFTPDGEELLVCGMGPMSDPMAGNGKQTWQRFAWTENPPRKVAEIADGERGNGLMETLAFHPDGNAFLMAGRLAQGKWNTAIFDAHSGKILHSLDCKMRVTNAKFTADGSRVILAGAVGQEKKKDGKCPDFGRVKFYRYALSA